MLTLKRLGWTGLLVAIQPVKLAVSLLSVATWVAYDMGREFVRDVQAIWTSQ